MALTTRITEDTAYKPASPDDPSRRFLIETDEYRWEALVWKYTVRESGSTVYRAWTPEGHSAYGMTSNEAVNDLAGILREVTGGPAREKTVSFDEIRYKLDPSDAERERTKINEAHTSKSLLARILGI